MSRESKRAYYLKNKAKENANSRVRYRLHREEERRKARERARRNPLTGDRKSRVGDYKKCWYRNRRESEIERRRKYYYDNREKINEGRRVNSHNNRERYRVYYARNKGSHRARMYMRRALLSMGPSMTKECYEGTFEANRKQFGVLTCWICFKPVVGEHGHLEHDLSPYRGGLNVPGNLGVAHASCNRSKGFRTRAEYWAQEGLL